MPADSSGGKQRPSQDLGDFARRTWIAVLIVTAVGSAILLLWLAFEVALLFFTAVLLAIFLHTLAGWVARRTRLGAGWALAVVVVGLLGVCVGLGWLLATPISQEIEHLKEQLPEAVARLQAQLEHYSWGKALITKLQRPMGLLSQAGNLLNKASSVFSLTLKGVVYIWVILFCGLFLAINPDYYVQGFLRLVPVSGRARGQVVLRAIGKELQHWLLGQIISMSIIGFLTWLGLHLLGIPASAVLGVLAGVLDFVPVAGPWIAGIIACVLALLKSPFHALYVACLFIGLHLFEGHVLIPLVQQRATRLPPVLTILAMVLFARLFGFLGLLLATPLLAFILISVKALYVEDVLQDRS